MKAELISIGDEILIGQIVNTNATYLSKRLGEIGIPVEKITVVGDALGPIKQAFQSAWKEHDVVIVTGGLGPTHDDISKEAVAEFFKKKLTLHKPTLKVVKERFARFGYAKMPEANVSQAMVPEDFVVLRNGAGTAPGLLYHSEDKTFVILPGVPKEMEWITQDSMLKQLKKLHAAAKRDVIRHQTLITTGIGESALAELIGPVTNILEEASTLAFLPSVPLVRLRISVRGASERGVASKIERIEQRLRDRVGKYVIGTNDETQESRVVAMLKAQGKRLAVAESCTGGMLSARLTGISGVSEVFMGGVVSYWDELKRDMLGVDGETLNEFGAVSEQTARQMADGLLNRTPADLTLSITGIAGPLGGTHEKPVGTVWIGLAERGRTTMTSHFLFTGDRELIRKRSVGKALELLHRRLVEAGETH